MFMKKENIVSVLMPTFVDVVFLSPETEVCPSLYRNLEHRDHELNDRISAYKFATQEACLFKAQQADLAIQGDCHVR